MRRSYEINSKKCHFYEGDNEISHDVSDLFDLLSIPVEAQGAVLYQWKGRITTYVDEGGEGKVIYLIPERDLKAFLKSAIAASPEKTIVNATSLLAKITQGRLDSIVGNDSPQLTHSDPTVRSAMLKASKNGFTGFYNDMDVYAKNKMLSPEQIKEWGRIKSLLPDRSGVINDRHLYALIMLIAPIWPGPKHVRPQTADRNYLIIQTVLLNVYKSDGFSKSEKALMLQEVLRQIGQGAQAKGKLKNDQPEP